MKYLWFTLVELIVVITILSILGTIGFLTVWWYSSKTRDSERTSDMTNIAKGFEILLAKGGTLPQPDANMITISASGAVIGYQGYAGSHTLTTLALWGKFVDPISNQYYTYSSNANLNKYQILWLLENGDNVSLSMWEISGIATAYAGNYDLRFPIVKWSGLGILIGTGANLNQPVQELASASFTGIDVISTSTGYTAVFGKNDSVSGSGSKLIAMKVSMTTTNTLPARDTSLVGYWDMETVTANGKLADLSGNGNDGVFSWGITYGTNPGVGNGKSILFNAASTGQVVTVPHNSIFNAPEMTISLWAKNYSLNPWSTTVRFIGKGHDTFWQVYVGNDADANFQRITSGITASNGTWKNNTYLMSFQSASNFHLYTFVYKNDIGIMYVDGKVSDIYMTWGGSWVPFSNTKDITIWNDEVGFERSYRGSIDDVRIYNRALSSSEILNLYTATK